MIQSLQSGVHALWKSNAYYLVTIVGMNVCSCLLPFQCLPVQGDTGHMCLVCSRPRWIAQRSQETVGASGFHRWHWVTVRRRNYICITMWMLRWGKKERKWPMCLSGKHITQCQKQSLKYSFILYYFIFYFNQLTHEEMFPDLLWVEISKILPDKGTSRETLSLYRFCGGIQMCMVDPVIHTSVWLPGRSESSCQS